MYVNLVSKSWNRDDLNLDLLEAKLPDRIRNILQIIVETGDRCSKVIVGGLVLIVFTRFLNEYRSGL